MCGLVGVAGNLFPEDEVIFKELLHADVVRGAHATGIALLKGKGTLSTFKQAYPSPVFLTLPTVLQELSSFPTNVVALGHNRHATKGASSDHANAHPFTHDHITLMHNGSLTSHYSLVQETFTVDSEAICKAFSLEDPSVVIPKLNGAFALVWIDTKNNTLNFVRNEERPLAIAYNTVTNRMWWASELDMLKWSLNREGFARTAIKYEKIFELPVGKWLQVPIKGTTIDLSAVKLKDVELHRVFTYPKYNSPVQLASYQGRNVMAGAENINVTGEKITEYEFGETREKALAKNSKSMIENIGRSSTVIRNFITKVDEDKKYCTLDSRLDVEVTVFTPYASNPESGTLTGRLVEEPNCKTVLYGISKDVYLQILNEWDGMISSYVTGITAPDITNISDLSEFTLTLKVNAIKCSSGYFEALKDTEVEDKIVDTSPLKKIVLSDGSTVNPGGSAVYTGTSQLLSKGRRYDIIKVKDNPLSITAKVGINLYSFPVSFWIRGELGEIRGFKDKVLDYETFTFLVDVGCEQCGDTNFTIEDSDTLHWTTDDTFCCPSCRFDTLNRGYL